MFLKLGSLVDLVLRGAIEAKAEREKQELIAAQEKAQGARKRVA